MTKHLSRSVLTIATGKPIYVEMAVNLARSFKWWHKHSLIQFTLATDQKHLLPLDLSDIKILEIKPGQYGYGFSPKLNLDKLAPADQTLFIDADCLCVGSLETVFDRFAGHAVSVIGGIISQGEWFGDVAAVCRQFGVTGLPKFNGGIYYLERGEISDRVYATARDLEPQYDQIGLVRLRNSPNEELLIAISMAIHKQIGIPEDGTIMADLFNFQCGLKTDVFKGSASLWNLPEKPLYRSNCYLTQAHPIIVHFVGYHTNRIPYTSEALRLEMVMAKRWTIWAATLYVGAICYIPQIIFSLSKDLLRPIYRKFFGTRRVIESDRI